MENVIETDRARMVRLCTEVGKDAKVALAAVQGIADILIGSGFITEAQFYRAVADRLDDL